jgi:hypothetical protein
MKKILIFALSAFVGIGVSGAAVRDANAPARSAIGAGNSSAISSPRTQPATVKLTDRAAAAPRATTARATSARTATPLESRATAARSAVPRGTAAVSTARSAVSGRRSPTTPTAVSARAAVARAAETAPETLAAPEAPAAPASSSAISETRTGAEYESCKGAYFACMDQFCKLKNDNYRRCSCSDRVYEFDSARSVIQDAGTKLTEFTESLDAVGMTAAQATAMRTSSEGENALISDGSASKALLQAIMNSIRGGDTNVGGRFSDLNSINISFNTSNAFGITDAGQVIASYNGKNLYSAIYGQCRNAVRADCNDASLQRAVTAYLMAVEQDCNTVAASIAETKKNMTAAVREGGAMLDLARVENRQKHNADDMSACLANVESAVLSEEVCGANYRKCLDNGEFIDLTTGKPIAGVANFYELGNLLSFSQGTDISNQQLAKISSNRSFVTNFEKRVKKFANPALDKCVENADAVWSDYLDKAMLDIYYAQKSKVSEIEKGCFDFVSACYMNGDKSLTTAMAELTGQPGIILQPDKIAVNGAICTEYVTSCDRMFGGTGIISKYIDQRQDADMITACRAVAKQCFDKFGGANYENFYYPHSGLFRSGRAGDWFALFQYEKKDGKEVMKSGDLKYKSECAIQLSKVTSCSDDKIMENVFGGFDLIEDQAKCIDPAGNIVDIPENGDTTNCTKNNNYEIIYAFSYKVINKDERAMRSTGVATEVYKQVVDILSTQCINVQGLFVEKHKIDEQSYGGIIMDPTDPTKPASSATERYSLCQANTLLQGSKYQDKIIQNKKATLAQAYGVADGENMCPRNYANNVDINFWGACLCFENGALRSKNGELVKCDTILPTNYGWGGAYPVNFEGTCVIDPNPGDPDQPSDPKFPPMSPIPEKQIPPQPTVTTNPACIPGTACNSSNGYICEEVQNACNPACDPSEKCYRWQPIPSWCSVPSKFFSASSQICPPISGQQGNDGKCQYVDLDKIPPRVF